MAGSSGSAGACAAKEALGSVTPESHHGPVAYSSDMWTRLYRYRAYRYLPITVIVVALAIGPGWAVASALLGALIRVLPG